MRRIGSWEGCAGMGASFFKQIESGDALDPA
jgi:hypothetical protein